MIKWSWVSLFFLIIVVHCAYSMMWPWATAIVVAASNDSGSITLVEDEDDAGGDDSAKKLVQSNAPPMAGQSATSGVRTSCKSIGNKLYVSFFGPNSGTSILPGQGVLTQKWNVLFGSQNYFLLSLSRFCHSSPRVDMLPPSRSTFTCPNFLQVICY